MHSSRAGERGINEDAPRQFSLDIQVKLLHIPGVIVGVGSFHGPLSGVKSRNIASAERTIDGRSEWPIRRTSQRARGCTRCKRAVRRRQCAGRRNTAVGTGHPQCRGRVDGVVTGVKSEECPVGDKEDAVTGPQNGFLVEAISKAQAGHEFLLGERYSGPPGVNAVANQEDVARTWTTHSSRTRRRIQLAASNRAVSCGWIPISREVMTHRESSRQVVT